MAIWPFWPFYWVPKDPFFKFMSNLNKPCLIFLLQNKTIFFLKSKSIPIFLLSSFPLLIMGQGNLSMVFLATFGRGGSDFSLVFLFPWCLFIKYLGHGYVVSEVFANIGSQFHRNC